MWVHEHLALGVSIGLVYDSKQLKPGRLGRITVRHLAIPGCELPRNGGERIETVRSFSGGSFASQ